MKLDRRQFLAAGGACLTWHGTGARLFAGTRFGGDDTVSPLDSLLLAHAHALPENSGGANHYPMAAEALEALGHEEAIADAWSQGAAGYAGTLERAAPIETTDEALGEYQRLGDWIDYFGHRLQHESWRSVIAAWAPRLAPGICAAAFHGVIRTAHAARALRKQQTDPRLRELAIGLAYWAARYTELPTTTDERGGDESLAKTLEGIEHPWLRDSDPVDFFAVVPRLTKAPIAPAVTLAPNSSDPQADLAGIVRVAAKAFLEILILKRYRIWLLHTVTGPAAVELLLPDVDVNGAQKLVAYARQAVVAMYTAFGAPLTLGAHLHSAPPEWPELIQRAAKSQSVHTIKLIDALHRFDNDEDLVCRSVAAQWFQWT